MLWVVAPARVSQLRRHECALLWECGRIYGAVSVQTEHAKLRQGEDDVQRAISIGISQRQHTREGWGRSRAVQAC